jgi:hypothetical protein
MAELDLTDPSHLADLLRASLPGFEDETPDRVAPLVEALERSDNDVFATIGKGHRSEPKPDPIQQHPMQALPEPIQVQQAPPEQPKKIKKKQAKKKIKPPPKPEPLQPFQQGPPEQQQQQQIEQQPLDMGGQGYLLEHQPDGPNRELGYVPVLARRGWTEIDRVRSKGQHAIYRLAASHGRHKPINSKFIGNCQSVRVSLPYSKPDRDAFVGTWIGTVEAKDHLLFSVEEVIARYSQQFEQRLPLSRVDLITGARFRGRRFSPISIYLGYEGTALDAKPTMYMLEGGSAAGKAEAMYLARTIDGDINTQTKFRFTPFSCSSNWYEGGLALSDDCLDPLCVYLSASLNRDGRNEYFKLSVTYERDLDPDRVVHPFELQVEAAMRVLAIADESGCKLQVGSGGVLQHSLGPIARALIPWEERPNGTTTPQEREMFCGCPKA